MKTMSRPLLAFVQAPKLLLWGQARPSAFALSFLQIASLISVAFLVAAWSDRSDAGPDAQFHIYGLNSAVTDWGLIALGVALAMIGARRRRLGPLVAAIVAINIWLWIATIGTQLIPADWLKLPRVVHNGSVVMQFLFAYAAWGLLLGVILRSNYRAVRQIVPEVGRGRAATVAAVSLLALFAHPSQPLFWSESNDQRTANLWEMALAAWPEAAPQSKVPREKPLDVEAIFDSQRTLLEATVSKLNVSQQAAGKYYFVGFASYASQNVFKSEIEKVRAVVDQRLGTAERSFNLINHRTTAETIALASATNLERGLGLLGNRIDRERDILVLYMTSHGAENLFSIDFPGFKLNQLTPPKLRQILDKSGIKNRVIIISACHSGSFVTALADEHTVVMTAASAERSSFGCSNEREWTYFGDALFNHAMRETTDLITAFDRARTLVEKWEKEQGLPASEPQISIGASIQAKLDVNAVNGIGAAARAQGSEEPRLSLR